MSAGMKRMAGWLAVTLLAAGVALAQDNQAGGPRGGGPRGGGFDMTQFRQRMMHELKTQMEATDEEWKVLEPLIEKAMTLSREVSSGGMRMMGRRGGRGGEGGEGAQAGENASPMSSAATALRKVLENKQATPAEIKAKLAALKEAREKVKQELAKTRDSLRELVTPRQEAQLVLIGALD